MNQPRVALIMGSQSDWSIMKQAAYTLHELDINYEARIISAHRTPDQLYNFADNARSQGFHIIIAGAGGAAHLPGMLAAKTSLPVLGVPVKSQSLNGMDSLLSIVQMPKGVPVGTLAIGTSGAVNSALLAASMLSIHDETVASHLAHYRWQQQQSVLNNPVPEEV